MNVCVRYRVRTLTGKEIDLDIEPDYKVCVPSKRREKEMRGWICGVNEACRGEKMLKDKAWLTFVCVH